MTALPPIIARLREFPTVYSAPHEAAEIIEELADSLDDLVADVTMGWGDPHTLRHARAALAKARGEK